MSTISHNAKIWELIAELPLELREIITKIIKKHNYNDVFYIFNKPNKLRISQRYKLTNVYCGYIDYMEEYCVDYGPCELKETNQFDYLVDAICYIVNAPKIYANSSAVNMFKSLKTDCQVMWIEYIYRHTQLLSDPVNYVKWIKSIMPVYNIMVNNFEYTDDDPYGKYYVWCSGKHEYNNEEYLDMFRSLDTYLDCKIDSLICCYSKRINESVNNYISKTINPSHIGIAINNLCQNIIVSVLVYCCRCIDKCVQPDHTFAIPPDESFTLGRYKSYTIGGFVPDEDCKECELIPAQSIYLNPFNISGEKINIESLPLYTSQHSDIA